MTENAQSCVTDETVERLAIHLVNQYRAMADTHPTPSLDDFSNVAQAEWRDNARNLLAIAFGERESRYAAAVVDHPDAR